MKKNSFAEAFYKNAGYIAVLLISVIYVASSIINISKSGKSVYEIIGSGILSLIVGIMINGVFRSIGVRRGEEDERTISTNLLHAKSVEEIVPFIDKLDEFCLCESERGLRDVRLRILAKEGLKYSDYFDTEGALINEKSIKELERPKKKTIYRALRVKIKPLVASNLTSDGGRVNDPFDFGKSKKEYSKEKSLGDIIIKLLLAVIFGYFGVSLVQDINVASIIWNLLQIILYITGGVIQMYNSYMWVVDGYRGNIIRKIDYLQKFKKYACEREIDNE